MYTELIVNPPYKLGTYRNRLRCLFEKTIKFPQAQNSQVCPTGIVQTFFEFFDKLTNSFTKRILLTCINFNQ